MFTRGTAALSTIGLRGVERTVHSFKQSVCISLTRPRWGISLGSSDSHASLAINEKGDLVVALGCWISGARFAPCALGRLGSGDLSLACIDNLLLGSVLMG